MTNFEGDILNAVLYAIQDHANNDVYVGLQVYDPATNANDYQTV